MAPLTCFSLAVSCGKASTFVAFSSRLYRWSDCTPFTSWDLRYRSSFYTRGMQLGNCIVSTPGQDGHALTRLKASRSLDSWESSRFCIFDQARYPLCVGHIRKTSSWHPSANLNLGKGIHWLENTDVPLRREPPIPPPEE